MIGSATTTRTFRSLRNSQFRSYFLGQLASVSGTFMQMTGQAWLVLQLTGSGTALGVVAGLQTLPILLLGAHAGVLAERFDRRRLFLVTQVAAAAQAGLLAGLAFADVVTVWMLYALALVLGVIMSVDHPTRQTLVHDLVGKEDLENAISLNMALQYSGRFIGPALAGVLIGAFDVAVCFAVNAASFGFAFAGVLVIDRSALAAQHRPERIRGLVRDGLAQVRTDPRLTTLLLTSIAVFGLAWQYDIVIPLFAEFTFGGDPTTFGLLLSAQAGGAVFGALIAARHMADARISPTRLAAAFGAAAAATALAPVLWVASVALVACGFFGIMLAVAMSTRIQMFAPDAVRGRVIALWTVCTVGMRPIFSPLVGAIGQGFGPRYALGLGSLATFLVIPVWVVVSRRRRLVQASTPVAASTAESVAEIGL